MSVRVLTLELLEKRAAKLAGRRHFIRKTSGVAAGVVAGVVLGACGSSGDEVVAQTPPPAGPTDSEILNFALNLEYLEAQFYQFAVFGTGLPANLLTGTGTQGAVTGGSQVTFTDPLVAQYAKEIAKDELDHVRFLRTALGASAVAQPALNISGTDPNGSFSTAARAAGLISAGQTFNPYMNDENFLLGAYIFEDVGVTAYKGASPLIQNKTFLEAAAGILAAEAYHAGLVRTVLYRKGMQAPALVDATIRISDARDSLDGPRNLDQGIRGGNGASNIVPADANGIAYSRSAGQVLNIAYLTAMATDRGGFFPAGVNGSIRLSAG